MTGSQAPGAGGLQACRKILSLRRCGQMTNDSLIRSDSCLLLTGAGTSSSLQLSYLVVVHRHSLVTIQSAEVPSATHR